MAPFHDGPWRQASKVLLLLVIDVTSGMLHPRPSLITLPNAQLVELYGGLVVIGKQPITLSLVAALLGNKHMPIVRSVSCC